MITVTTYQYLKQLSSDGTSFALRCSNDVEQLVPFPVGDVQTVTSALILLPLRLACEQALLF